jgi:uracil-xanthine permease
VLGLSPPLTLNLLSAAFILSGLGSLLQSLGLWKFGVRLPFVMLPGGAPIVLFLGIAAESGLQTATGAVILTAVFYFVVLPLFAQLLRFFPTVVIGTMIVIIGVNLIRFSALLVTGQPDTPEFGNAENILLGLAMIGFIIFFFRVLTGTLRQLAVLLGLVAGTVVAAAFGATDFSGVWEGSVVGVPEFLPYGAPHFDVLAALPLLIFSIASMAEATGQTVLNAEVVGKNIDARSDSSKTIRGDAIISLLGGFFGMSLMVTSGENIGIVRVTEVRSRFVTAVAGAILIVIGLFAPLLRLINVIPAPVVGGTALIVYAIITVLGIQMLRRVDFNDHANMVIVATALAIGLLPILVPGVYDRFPPDVRVLLGSGVAMGAFVAAGMNILFHHLWPGRRAVEPERAPRAEVTPVGPRMAIDEVNNLSREEFVEKFGTLFQDGRWIVEEVYDRRPFESIHDLRRAFQDVLFDAPPERQLELIRSYPDLGGMAHTDDAAEDLGLPPEEVDGLATVAVPGLGAESLRDQSAAGLDRLSPREFEDFQRLNQAYREKFGFPFIMAVRGNTKAQILANGRARLENSPAQERATALVEIAKIANFRLQDLVDSAHPAEVA